MSERQSRHSDDELIEAMQQETTPSKQGRSGGQVNRKVGTRAEERRATDPENSERALGSDNPDEDARKGEKTRDAIQESRGG